MPGKYGLFSEPPSYVTVGDPYKDRAPPDSREQDLNFKATVGRRGKNNDATFDRQKTLFEGERYVDSSRRHLIEQNAKSKKAVTDTPFKPSQPPKRRPGPGTHIGSFGGKVPYYAETPDRPKKKGEIPSELPNILTNPPKKGTYGMPRTTLSERQNRHGLMGEYTYQADPIPAADVRRKALIEEKKKMVTDMPFRPTNPAKKGGLGVPGTTLFAKAHKNAGVCGEYTYKAEGPGTRQPSKPFASDSAWRPNNPPKKGYNSTINKFPKYHEDPESAKLARATAARRAAQEKLAGGNAWSPSTIPKQMATKSIVRMNT